MMVISLMAWGMNECVEAGCRMRWEEIPEMKSLGCGEYCLEKRIILNGQRTSILEAARNSSDGRHGDVPSLCCSVARSLAK
jgi:hypothetical protein